MATQVIHVDPAAPDFAALEPAVVALRDGGLVVIPTETVYGVACRADHAAGMARLRALKSREGGKAFTVHIASREDANSFVPELSGMAARFARKAWPGPLTLILPVADPTQASIMAGRNGSAAAAMYYDGSIGLRCPDDSVAQRILQSVEFPIVAASANLAGRAPPKSGEEALKGIGGEIDLLVDAGQTRYSKSSTIVRVEGDKYRLVREGVFDARMVHGLSTIRLLFVCTGNTCRSPMAASLAGKLLAERLGCSIAYLTKRGINIHSAGISGGVGGAAKEAISVMSRRGLDLSGHRSSLLSSDDVRQADYVFTMTSAHRDAVVRMAPTAESRVALMLDGEDVRDPFGGAEEEYEVCAATIERGLRARLQEVVI